MSKRQRQSPRKERMPLKKSRRTSFKKKRFKKKVKKKRDKRMKT